MVFLEIEQKIFYFKYKPYVDPKSKLSFEGDGKAILNIYKNSLVVFKHNFIKMSSSKVKIIYFYFHAAINPARWTGKGT